MNTLDKINESLLSLEKDLNQLQHYSNEIGIAKDAATKVVATSADFVNKFQKQIEIIKELMQEATTTFQDSSSKSAEQFDQKLNKASKNFGEEIKSVVTTFQDASEQFQGDIAKTKDRLSTLSKSLEQASQRVEALASKLDSLEIPKHFEKIHESQEFQLKNQKTLKKRSAIQLFIQVLLFIMVLFLVVIRLNPKLL